MFYNAGNYGIPFVSLAFGPEYIGVVAIVLMVQNLLNFTLGIWLFQEKSQGLSAVLKGFLKVPVVPAILLALGLRYLHETTGFSLPPAAAVPLGHLANGLIPVALMTLGVQLSRIRIGERWRPLSALVVMRLAISPLLALGLVALFRVEAPLAAVLIAMAGLPMAVNVYILASEYGEDAELASQGVFWTTLLSAGTLTALLYGLG
jgi:predicted permease